MPKRPSARRIRSTIVARNGRASAAESSAPDTPKRTQSLWSVKNAAISSAEDTGDRGGNSCAMPEKLVP